MRRSRPQSHRVSGTSAALLGSRHGRATGSHGSTLSDHEDADVNHIILLEIVLIGASVLTFGLFELRTVCRKQATGRS